MKNVTFEYLLGPDRWAGRDVTRPMRACLEQVKERWRLLEQFEYAFDMRNSTREDWELAGLYSEAGHLDRPVATGCIQVPNVIEIDGGRLYWDVDFDRPIEEREPGPGMLNEFIAL